jgi:hypothetical protein
MDTQGSIRSSLKGSSSGFRPTPLEPTLLETAKQFLESFQLDLRIRQVLRAEKLEESVAKHTYYVLGNEQKYEPGFLLILQGKPVLFVSSRFQFGFALRLRIHPSVFQTQAVFIATLDTIHATLRLEDVLYLEGNPVMKLSFSKRFSMLKSFYRKSFHQDKHLSGLQVLLADYFPLETLEEKVDSNQFYSIDLVPEQGGRRRWHLPLRISSVSGVPASTFQQVPVAAVPVPVAAVPVKGKTTAFAYKIKGLPDTYDLQDEKGVSMGKAAVQSAQLSLALRTLFSKGVNSVPVSIEWNEEFSRFKILETIAAAVPEPAVSSAVQNEYDEEHPDDV